MENEVKPSEAAVDSSKESYDLGDYIEIGYEIEEILDAHGVPKDQRKKLKELYRELFKKEPQKPTE